MIESATQERAVAASTFIEASRETVFSILTDPARFSDWIQGEADFDPVAGSDFTVRFPQFETVVSGEVREIVENQRIVFTWGVSKGPQSAWFPPGSSTVSVELEEEAGGTRVKLVHAELPPKEVDAHHGGWRFHLSRLDLKANRSELSKSLPTTLEAWCDAWSEPDGERRAELLERCCGEGLTYADEYAYLEGRDRLSTHIGNTQKFAPGSKLVIDAEPRICRGEALIPWKVVGENGSPLYEGTLHAELDDSGRILGATSFWSAPPAHQ